MVTIVIRGVVCLIQEEEKGEGKRKSLSNRSMNMR